MDEIPKTQKTMYGMQIGDEMTEYDEDNETPETEPEDDFDHDSPHSEDWGDTEPTEEYDEDSGFDDDERD